MDKAIEWGSGHYTVIGASFVAWGIWRAWVRPSSKASSSRPEAPFQIALKLIERHRAKARPEDVGEMIDRV